MSVDLRNDKLLTLEDAGKLIPSRRGTTTHVRTIKRWIRVGIRLPSGEVVKLDVVRVGPRRLISLVALNLFLERMQSAGDDLAQRRQFFRDSAAGVHATAFERTAFATSASHP